MFYHNSNKEYTEENKNRRIINFNYLREGDFDPVLGKKIDVLIENGGDFIVYLDPEMNIQYAVCPEYASFSQYYGLVLNKVAELEGLSDKSFMTRKQIREYRSMIGAAIARMYEHDSNEVIFSMLGKAEYFLKSRVTETARIWYLSSASLAFVFITIVYFLLYIGNVFRLPANLFAAGIVLGTAGAYLSLIMNSKKINVNPSSGRIIHFFESITRLIIGMIGGFFISLVFYSGLISFGSEENRFLNIMIFSFTSGFSERMVPNLINQFETHTTAHISQQKKNS